MIAFIGACGGKSTSSTALPLDAGDNDAAIGTDGGIQLPDGSDDAASDGAVETHGVGYVYIANSTFGNSATIDAIFKDAMQPGCNAPTALGTCVIHACTPPINDSVGRNAGTLR